MDVVWYDLNGTPESIRIVDTLNPMPSVLLHHNVFLVNFGAPYDLHSKTFRIFASTAKIPVL